MLTEGEAVGVATGLVVDANQWLKPKVREAIDVSTSNGLVPGERSETGQLFLGGGSHFDGYGCFVSVPGHRLNGKQDLFVGNAGRCGELGERCAPDPSLVTGGVPDGIGVVTTGLNLTGVEVQGPVVGCEPCHGLNGDTIADQDGLAGRIKEGSGVCTETDLASEGVGVFAEPLSDPGNDGLVEVVPKGVES